MESIKPTRTNHTDSNSLKDGELVTSTGYVAHPQYEGAGGFDPDRLERLRSRVAVDTRGRLMDAEMEKHRKKGTWKIDVRAVPILLLFWLANFIDRTVSLQRLCASILTLF